MRTYHQLASLVAVWSKHTLHRQSARAAAHHLRIKATALADAPYDIVTLSDVLLLVLEVACQANIRPDHLLRVAYWRLAELQKPEMLRSLIPPGETDVQSDEALLDGDDAESA